MPTNLKKGGFSVALLLVYICVMSFTLPVVAGANTTNTQEAVYTSLISQQELLSAGYNLPHLAGRWEIKFMYEQGYSLNKDGLELARGAYLMDSETLSLLDFAGPSACVDNIAGGSLRGTYNWAFDGQVFRLTEKFDQCGGRVLPLTLKPFQINYANTVTR